MPLLLDSQVEGIIKTRRVAVGELAILKQYRTVADQDQHHKAAQTQKRQDDTGEMRLTPEAGVVGSSFVG